MRPMLELHITVLVEMSEKMEKLSKEGTTFSLSPAMDPTPFKLIANGKEMNGIMHNNGTNYMVVSIEWPEDNE